jgi:hypothetical protein
MNNLRITICCLKKYFLFWSGWHWEIDTKWEIDMSGTNVDSEGWTFNSDFGHFVDCSSGSGKKGMIHFVRRRRRIRSQYFDGTLRYTTILFIFC